MLSLEIVAMAPELHQPRTPHLLLLPNACHMQCKPTATKVLAKRTWHHSNTPSHDHTVGEWPLGSLCGQFHQGRRNAGDAVGSSAGLLRRRRFEATRLFGVLVFP